jgi:hypothetical protein
MKGILRKYLTILNGSISIYKELVVFARIEGIEGIGDQQRREYRDTMGKLFFFDCLSLFF